MKIEKVTCHQADYPTMEQILKKSGTALLAATLLAGTIAAGGCKPTRTVGIIADPESSDESYTTTTSAESSILELMGDYAVASEVTQEVTSDIPTSTSSTTKLRTMGGMTIPSISTITATNFGGISLTSQTTNETAATSTTSSVNKTTDRK